MDSPSPDSIARLKAEWDSLQPLSPENYDRLWKKLRLEWNYHSNHIEGNTLTYGETQQLFVFGETRGNHTLREYEEMKAHDVAIAQVQELARDSRPLSEVDVRNLNLLLLKEPFWKEATTPEGQPTRKKIVPGRYKLAPNDVLTLTGEKFRFVDPMDVPVRMQEFLEVLNESLSAPPELLSALSGIHHEFLLIHPFDDGNGRVGRLLLNYALLKNGYPPIVIRTEQKKEYIAALHRADMKGRDYSELETFLGKRLAWSLRLGVTAAKGEPIDDPLDVEKEIALFVKENSKKPDEPRNPENTLRIWTQILGPLFTAFQEKVTPFKSLFAEVQISSNFGAQGGDWIKPLHQFFHSNGAGVVQILLSFHCERYSGLAVRPFDYTLTLTTHLDKYEWRITAANKVIFQRLYSEDCSSSEVEALIALVLKQIFEDIKIRAAQK